MRTTLLATVLTVILGVYGTRALPSPSEDPIHSPLDEHIDIPVISKLGTEYKVAAPATNPLGGSLRYVENSGVCGKCVYRLDVLKQL